MKINVNLEHQQKMSIIDRNIIAKPSSFTFHVLCTCIDWHLTIDTLHIIGTFLGLYKVSLLVREHPFNLKRGPVGAMGFRRKKFLSPKIDKFFSVSEMGRTKYSVSTLCLKKYCFCRKKIMPWQLVAKKKFCCVWLRKNHSPHFKLNGCSLMCP